MTAVKERIMGAVTLMTDKDAELFWDLIQSRYIIQTKSWNDISEEVPDEIDKILLKKIDTNPECHEFISSEAAMKELGLA